MADELFDKADALMRRRRAFVAGGATVTGQAQAQHAEGLEQEPVGGEDVPVLTDIVSPDRAPPIAPSSLSAGIEALLVERLADALPLQRDRLRRELATWLDEELPQIVVRVLDGVTDQLVVQIASQARVALLPRLQAALSADTEAQPDE